MERELKRIFKIVVLSFFALLGTRASAQIGFPYCETFQTPGTQANTVFGGNARLTEGVLRLTSNQNDQRGYVYIDVPFPSTYGLKVEFEYFSYGGTGLFLADGISMFLFDGDAPNFSPGGFGGSLGYAQRGNEPGLANAYLGIGFDEFGGFGVSSEGKNGGFSVVDGNGRTPNSIVLRGPGNGFTGYPFVVGRKTTSTGNDGLTPGGQFEISSGGGGSTRVTDPMQVGYRRVNMELQPDPDGIGFFITLSMVVTTQPGLPRQVTIFDRPYDFPAPKNLKIGFAASTGGYNNYHEIRNLKVEVSADDALQDPLGVDFTDFASCAGQENQFYITDEDVMLPNENSVIRCIQFYESLEDIEAESVDVCSQARCLEQNRVLILPQGVFKASDQAGGFTFFPNEEYIDDEVTVYYTITDSYGKSSKGNAMTLEIKESPKPINLLISGENEIIEQFDICKGETIVLEGKGSEVYQRYEWRKDGILIEGANQPVFSVQEEGEYEIIGYNRKNCPAISNKVRVNLPDYPVLAVDSPVVGCTPGQTVDLTSQISGYDPTRYDYQLSGMGLTLVNDQLKAVKVSGLYELRVKLKSLDCYSDPISLEVFIQEKELTINFDFEVQGTGIKDDASGGIFPDDVIQFTDRSDDRAENWEWDFGDGSSSTDQNPTHVFGKKGNFEVKLVITDKYGCQKIFTKTLSITRSYRLMVPTGFTPTKEENKTFLPKFKGLVQFELLVFNTWGELIFKTSDLETEGWDGTLEGRLQDAGIFVYRIEGIATDGEKVSESGKFRLIR
ncbi:PKD domain-containing protein [Algoriphagus lacus]|uniref:PKD domain-containing protein n=1 Tax=Algoriphagus lacus TaxID=2056311 RepID=A0A418PP95_9BACT|nr:PKD domain-containing protein [Algoriphagus lacus]